MLKQPPVEPPVQNQVKVEPGLWSRSVAQFHGTDDDSDDYYDSPEFKQKEDKLHRELTGWRYHPVEENEVKVEPGLPDPHHHPTIPPVQNQVKVEPGLSLRSVAQCHRTDEDSMALRMSQTMSQRPSLSSPVRDYGKGTRPRSTQPYYDGEHCDSKVCQRRLLPARILTVSLTTYLTCPCSGMWFLQGQRFENFRQAKPVSAQVSRDKVMQMLHLEFDSNGKLIFCDFTEYANQTKGNKSNFIIDCLKNVVPLHFKFRHVRSTILDIAGKVKGAKGGSQRTHPFLALWEGGCLASTHGCKCKYKAGLERNQLELLFHPNVSHIEIGIQFIGGCTNHLVGFPYRRLRGEARQQLVNAVRDGKVKGGPSQRARDAKNALPASNCESPA